MKRFSNVFISLLLLLSLVCSSSAVARDNPFPRFSIGTAGLIHYLDNELIRDVLIDNDYGLMTGIQFDADLRVLSSDKAAAYIMVNISEPLLKTEIAITTVEDPIGGTSETLSIAYQYRSVGARFAIRAQKHSRFWFEDGGSFLKSYDKDSSSGWTVIPTLVHGWFLGVGGTRSLLPWLSIYFRLAYTSTPRYDTYYGDWDSGYISTRTEMGGYSAAAGLRFEI